MDKHSKIILRKSSMKDSSKTDSKKPTRRVSKHSTRSDFRKRKNFNNCVRKRISKNTSLKTSVRRGNEIKRQATVRYYNVHNRAFQTFEEVLNIIDENQNIERLELTKCSIKTKITEALPNINTLTSIELESCDEYIFALFINQEELQKIEVCNYEKTWNGFPHDIFNEICRNCKNLEHIVLKGAGTTSYFDSDDFPYQIKKLETTSITHHWYVGLKCPRINFLKTQKGTLKELTIHELPYDFDGGKVLNYIFEKMGLDTFYYGKIPLIVNGKKQEVKEFTASEIQITSAIEMLRQFPSIEKFTMKISDTDICSNDIEKALNSSADVFSKLKEFEVIDKSNGTLGVFLQLFKVQINLQTLKIDTNDRCLNQIIQELPRMHQLEEIHLKTTVQNAYHRYTTIKAFAPNIKVVKVLKDFVGEAREFFGNKVNEIDTEGTFFGLENEQIEIMYKSDDTGY